MKWSRLRTVVAPTVVACSAVVAFWGCRSSAPEQAALGEPLLGLTPVQKAQFHEGKKIFQREFTPEDGLGPLFNSVSCAECHEDPVLGGVGDEVEVHVSRVTGRGGCDPLFEEGGLVIQQKATPLLQAQGIMREEIPPSATSQARRSTSAIFGFGLVDAIPDEAILAREDPRDTNRDGIRGRANRSIDGRVGRFGRKAAVARLADFNRGAFPFEMGITTPFSLTEETINGKPVPPNTDPAADPEISQADTDKVNDFVRFLAPPPRVFPTEFRERMQVSHGERLFAAIKCASCHVPEMTTGPSTSASFNRRPVALYSDLLIHDMGPDLADICLGLAGPSDFRTELLMGLRFREKFLHDGSAKTVREAIERHGGEAEKSRDAFKALSDQDKAALLKFLGTI